MTAELTSVFQTRADALHLFSQNAAHFPRTSVLAMHRWASRGTRCETARHQRACSQGLIPWGPHRPRTCESPRSVSPHFIDGLGQRLSTWVTVWRPVTRRVRPTFLSSQASAFVKTLCKSTRQRRTARIDSFSSQIPDAAAFVPSAVLGSWACPARASSTPSAGRGRKCGARRFAFRE
jgi:hypothetical protein